MFFLDRILRFGESMPQSLKRFLSNFNVMAIQNSLDAFRNTLYVRNDCDNEYIGQAKRQFGTRLKEHQKAVFLCRKENSTLSEHTCLTNHTIGWDNSKIITTNRRYHSLLPDAYLHLVRKKAAN